MQIRTLESIALETITAAFNEAFRDYFIPLQFTPENIAMKLKVEGIRPAYSIGAFDGNKLVGFILHGYDIVDGVQTIYNGGTGVIPFCRGRGLTRKMYGYAIPLLKEAGICHHVLEVIDQNEPARKIYEALEFRIARKLAAFKGVPVVSGAPSVAIRTIEAIPLGTAFAGMVPSWQNATASVNRYRSAHQVIGAFVQEQLVGYAAFVPAAGRVKQFAVHADYRRQGIGTALFQHMMESSRDGSLLVTNIDVACTPAIAFLQRLRLQLFLRLYEMKLEVK